MVPNVIEEEHHHYQNMTNLIEEEEVEPHEKELVQEQHETQAQALHYDNDPRNNETTSNDNNSRIFRRRQDLNTLNLMDQPVWVFDIVKREMWYANDAAVELWSAPNLSALLQRNFKDDMSDATKSRLDDYLLKFANGENNLKEQWTFYPNQQGPKTVDLTCKGIHIEEGRLAMLVQGRYKEEEFQTDAEKQALRSVEMLRHLPVAVCIMDLDGNVIEQNPEALAVFGPIDDAMKRRKEPANCDEEEENDSVNNHDQLEEEDYSTFVKRFVDKDLGIQTLKQAATESGKVIGLETQQETMHGPKWSAIQIRQTKDPVSSNPVLLYSARDITAIVEAKKQQAVATDAAKMGLVSDLAHAMRSPLQSIVGVVELISRQQRQVQQQENNSTSLLSFSPEKQQRNDDTSYSNLLMSAAQSLMTTIEGPMDESNNRPSCGNDLVTAIRPIIDTSTNSRPQKIAKRSFGKESRLEDIGKSQRRRQKQPIINLEHARFDIKVVLNGILATIGKQAQAKNLSLQVIMKNRKNQQCNWDNDNPIFVIGDANRLGQVLYELLNNAVKYTSAGGIAVTIQVLPRSQSRHVSLRFDIKDTGVGLNLEQQRTCMLVEESGETTFSKRSGGIGVPQCRSIVEAMGGCIDVNSKPDQGATFRIDVPFLRPFTTSRTTGSSSNGAAMNSTPLQFKARRTRSCSSLETVPDEGGLQILLVDEDNIGRIITKTLLEQAGHSVTTADSGDAMIYAASQRSGHFDIVLMETELNTTTTTTQGSNVRNQQTTSTNRKTTRMNTLDAARKLRSIGYSTDTLPILALTAGTPRVDYIELGLNDWLTKPIFMKDVQTAMTNAICNVACGANSVGTGSIFDGEQQSLHSLQNTPSRSHQNRLRCRSGGGGGGSAVEYSRGGTSSSAGSIGDVCPTMPRRGSFIAQ